MMMHPQRPRDERDDVARLVRLAGKRQAVPDARTERVRAAARAQWQAEVGRRARRRYAVSAAGMAVAASLVLLLTLRFLPQGPAGPSLGNATIVVDALVGSAFSGVGLDDAPLSQARLLKAGDAVRPGSEIVTADGSRLAMRLGSGHSVRLDRSTKLRLLDGGALALERGAIYVDSGLDTASGPPLDVHTPLGTIREIGTQFEVRLVDASVHVSLREGAVLVRHDRQSHQVSAGTRLELDPDGGVTRRAIFPDGAEWSWIVEITPAIDLEGRTARSFLDWVARETGWTLAFADEDVGRSAEEIVLAGTVERLTPEQALDAVLPTCRMTYRVDAGTLLIDDAAEE